MKYQFYQIIVCWRSASVSFQSFSITDIIQRRYMCTGIHFPGIAITKQSFRLHEDSIGKTKMFKLLY